MLRRQQTCSCCTHRHRWRWPKQIFPVRWQHRNAGARTRKHHTLTLQGARVVVYNLWRSSSARLHVSFATRCGRRSVAKRVEIFSHGSRQVRMTTAAARKEHGQLQRRDSHNIVLETILCGRWAAFLPRHAGQPASLRNLVAVRTYQVLAFSQVWNILVLVYVGWTDPKLCLNDGLGT